MRDKSLKLRNIFFLLIVTLVLIGTTVYILFFKTVDKVSETEKRELTTFQELVGTSFIKGSFQTTIEAALSDQFLFRYELVNEKKSLDLYFTMLFVDNSDQLKLTQVGETPIRQIGDTHYLINNIISYDKDVEDRFMKKIEQINQLAKDYPDINIFVYKPTQVYETDIFDEANDIKSYGTYYRDLLKSNLEVPYAELEIKDLSDYMLDFYQSDHHWNYQGSYQGYKDIMKLMFGDNANILTPISLEKFDDKLTFSGTYEARVGDIYEGEPFYIYKFDLPEYSVYVDGVKQEIIYDMNHFEENLKNTDSGYYYGVAYETYNSYVVYENEAVEDNTLLIVGDSYAAAIEPLLINSFSKIYFIQPFDYYWQYGKYFDYDEFIANNHVDNILFMYTVENYFLNSSGDNRYKFFEIYRNGGN